jgi:tetratricopeptide (TPR) repeat protein
MRSTRRTPIALALAGLATFALLLGACSDDGDDEADDTTTTTEAAADFVTEVDALCEANDEATDELNDDLNAALEDVDAALQEGDEDAAADAADEAIAVFEQGVDANEQFIDDVEALGVPDEQRETVDGVIELLEEQNAVIADGVAALEERDYDAFIEVGQEISDEEDEIDERSQALADELGTEHCGPDDDDEDGGSDGADEDGGDESETFDPENA